MRQPPPSVRLFVDDGQPEARDYDDNHRVVNLVPGPARREPCPGPTAPGKPVRSRVREAAELVGTWLRHQIDRLFTARRRRPC